VSGANVIEEAGTLNLAERVHRLLVVEQIHGLNGMP
jgi:hypothetical protein